MIVYVDSSILARAYLVDEPGHAEATSLLADPANPVVTSSWSRIEVAGAIVRASRAASRPHVLDEAALLLAWDNDTAADGAVGLLSVARDTAEARALGLVKEHGLRAMDAWHLAVAELATPELAEPGEQVAFASRDAQQAAVAELLGFTIV